MKHLNTQKNLLKINGIDNVQEGSKTKVLLKKTALASALTLSLTAVAAHADDSKATTTSPVDVNGNAISITATVDPSKINLTSEEKTKTSQTVAQITEYLKDQLNKSITYDSNTNNLKLNNTPITSITYNTNTISSSTSKGTNTKLTINNENPIPLLGITLNKISNNGNAINIGNTTSTGSSSTGNNDGINIVSSTNKFTLNFDKNSNTKLIDNKYIYVGNINVTGNGYKHSSTNYYSTDPNLANLTVNFDGDVKGNITASNIETAQDIGNKTNTSHSFYDFKNGSTLDGNITYQGGYGVFKFEGNGGITGTINTNFDGEPKNGYGWVNITLGDVNGTGTNSIGGITNTTNQPDNFVFNQNGIINGNIQSIHDNDGNNIQTIIKFNGKNNEIKGNISSGWLTKNEISFNNEEGTNLITGNISNSVGTNTITFNGINNTIGGDVIVKGVSDTDTINQISFINPNGNNTINGNVTSINWTPVKKEVNDILATGGVLNINKNVQSFNSNNINNIVISTNPIFVPNNELKNINILDFTKLAGTLNIGGAVLAGDPNNSRTTPGDHTTINTLAAKTINVNSASVVNGINTFYAKNIGIGTVSVTGSGSNTINFSGADNTINADTTFTQTGTGSNIINITGVEPTGATTPLIAGFTVDTGKTLQTTKGTTTIQFNRGTGITNASLGGNISSIVADTTDPNTADDADTTSTDTISELALATTSSASPAAAVVPAEAELPTSTAVTNFTFINNGTGNSHNGGIALTLNPGTILASGDGAVNNFTLGASDELTAVNGSLISSTDQGENNITLNGTAKIGTLNLYADGGGLNTITIKDDNSQIGTLNFSGVDGQQLGQNVISVTNSVNKLNVQTINTTSGTTVIHSAGNNALTLTGVVKTIGADATTYFDLPVTDTLTFAPAGTNGTGASVQTENGAQTVFNLANKVPTVSNEDDSDTTTNTVSLTLANANIVTSGTDSKTIFGLSNSAETTPVDTDTANAILDLGDASGNVIAQNGGETVFNLDSTTNTIKNLSRLKTNDGSNIFNFTGNNHTLTLDDQLTTINGTTHFDLGNNVKTATISDVNNITTADGGVTAFDFNADNQTLKFGNSTTNNGDTLTTSAGTTQFNIGNADGSSQIGTATIDGKLVTSGSGQTEINLNSASNDNTFTLNFGGTETTNLAGTTPNGVVYNLNKAGATVTLNVEPTTAASATQSTPITYTASGNTVFNFNQDATLANNFATGASNGGTLDFNLVGNHTATLTGDNIAVTSLTGNGIVDLSQEQPTTPVSDFHLLTIGNTTTTATTSPVVQTPVGLAGNIDFKLRVDPSVTGAKLGGQNNNTYGNVNSDRVVVNQGEAGTHKLYLVSTIDALTSNDKKIAVATVKDGDQIHFVTVKVDSSNGEVYQPLLSTAETNANGMTGNGDTGYTTYFLGKTVSTGVNTAYQNLYATGLQLNYGLFLANFNSLDKRLGELRHNPYSQGSWARIFGGSQTNAFNATSRTDYRTLQAGYDKAISVGGVANHLGMALAYSTASNSSKVATYIGQQVNSTTGQIIPVPTQAQLSKADSKAVELALYNSYVKDSGLYSDTIAKLSLIHSNFGLSNDANQQTNTKNHALTLSQEVGYLHQLGASQWQVTPSYELTLGYLNGTNFSRTVGTSVQTAKQSSVVTLRNKLGATFSYTGKINGLSSPQTGSVYLGTFYEYDNIFGGKVAINTNDGGHNQVVGLRNNGRLVLNFGANASLTKKARVYFDVQKSFGGKVNTDVQLNSGVRFSF